MKLFYNEQDLNRGYVMAMGRGTERKKQRLVSVAVAGYCGIGEQFPSLEDFSRYMTYIKRKVKKQKVSAYHVERRMDKKEAAV